MKGRAGGTVYWKGAEEITSLMTHDTTGPTMARICSERKSCRRHRILFTAPESRPNFLLFLIAVETADGRNLHLLAAARII